MICYAKRTSFLACLLAKFSTIRGSADRGSGWSSARDDPPRGTPVQMQPDSAGSAQHTADGVRRGCRGAEPRQTRVHGAGRGGGKAAATTATFPTYEFVGLLIDPYYRLPGARGFSSGFRWFCRSPAFSPTPSALLIKACLLGKACLLVQLLSEVVLYGQFSVLRAHWR